MNNYIKSEIYRISHHKTIYILLEICATLGVIVNLLLAKLGLANKVPLRLIISPMFFVFASASIALMLYDNQEVNGSLKNTPAFGISRVKVFLGQCLVSALTFLVITATALLAFWASASLLAVNFGPSFLVSLVTELLAVSLIVLASLVSMIWLIHLFSKTFIVLIAWLSFWLFIPQILFYLGLAFPLIRNLAMWLPLNLLSSPDSLGNPIWSSPAGMAKCLLIGLLALLLFSSLGIQKLRQKDL